MSEKDGGPAFPSRGGDPVEFDRTKYAPRELGMSLRDYFAGQALVSAGAMLASRGMPEGKTPADILVGWAEMAYLIADQMLKERSK